MKYLILLTMLALTGCGQQHGNSSDPPGGRSGMQILVDELTQCHYLYRGALTPRMDTNGKQLCGKDVPR